MSDDDTIQVERDGAVAVVTLNRPDKLNSFNRAMRAELLAAVRELNADDGVRIAVLTGAGRAFSAGADLTELPVGREVFHVDDQLNHEYRPVLLAIHEAPKPWLSAVNGACAGVGSAFAMACDLTVMAEDAFLYQAFAAIGLVPDGGATWHLARTLGRKRAYEMIVTGEKLKAQQCLEWGLCNRVVAAESLLADSIAWAQEIASRAPLSLRHAKAALNAAMEQPLAAVIAEEARLQQLCVSSEDAAEGTAAFLEKRQPAWRGR